MVTLQDTQNKASHCCFLDLNIAYILKSRRIYVCAHYVTGAE